jgi:hypothetical protein
MARVRYIGIQVKLHAKEATELLNSCDEIIRFS